MLEIQLLGVPDVSVDGLPIEVDTRKAIALLAYLAIEQTASRDTLMALLWSDAPPERARASLRRTLSALRAGLGGAHVTADRHRVSLTGAPTVDVHVFHRELAQQEAHEHATHEICPTCLPHLTRAVAAYRGDFLRGFSVRGAPVFEDWQRTVGEGLRLQVGSALSRLAHGHASLGEHRAAITTTKDWIEHDPLHEPAHRHLMLLHAWNGDRPAAVAAFRNFAGILDRELGVPPLDETTELYEAILDEDLPPAPAAPRTIGTVRTHARADAPFLLDRTAELAALVEAPRTAGGSFIAVVGASWLGKTRLLTESTTAMRVEGHAVLNARAHRLERSLPHGVVSQILAPLVRIAERTGNAPEWAVAEASRLDPRLGRSGRDPADRYGELRLHESVEALVATASETESLVIVIDDAQWIDRASAVLIGYLTRRLDRAPATFVIAARSGDTTRTDVDELLAGASRTIRLEPLTGDAIAELVPDGTDADEIARWAGGVPLLMLEALGESPTRGGTPGIVRYVESKLREVGTLARQVLAAMSVLTGHADATLIREVSGRSEEEVVDGVEQLLAAGLIGEVPGSDTLRYSLDALESVVEDSTSLIRRRLLHRRAAAALERRPWAREDARLAGMIAVHHQHAGDRRAVEWFRLTGNLARRVYAHEEARTAYEAAIALDGDDDGTLHLALGEVAFAEGRYDLAKRDLQVAASRATGPTAALVEHRLGDIHRTLGRFDRAAESFEHSLPEHPQPSDLFADWALLDLRTGHRDRAAEHADRALEAARMGGTAKERSRALTIAAVVDPDRAAAARHADEALELAADDDIARMAALNTKAGLLAEAGEAAGAIAIVEEAIDIARRTGHRHREAALHDHLGDLHHQTGDEESARRELTRAVTLFADIEVGEREPEIWLLRQW